MPHSVIAWTESSVTGVRNSNGARHLTNFYHGRWTLILTNAASEDPGLAASALVRFGRQQILDRPHPVTDPAGVVCIPPRMAEVPWQEPSAERWHSRSFLMAAAAPPRGRVRNLSGLHAGTTRPYTAALHQMIARCPRPARKCRRRTGARRMMFLA